MPMAKTSNDDLMRVLGQLESKLDAVAERIDRADDLFNEERRSAHESRSVIHRRLDEQAEKIGSLRTDIEIHGKIEAQLRDNIASLKQTVSTEISPTIDEWKRIKFLGGVVSGALIALGVTAGAAAAWLYDWLAIVLRYLSKGS